MIYRLLNDLRALLSVSVDALTNPKYCWQAGVNGTSLSITESIKIRPPDCHWTVPRHSHLKVVQRLVPLTMPISRAATFFLPLVRIIIHLLKYVILLFHLWAHTCTSAKPQLTPESYCRKRKHSVLLLSPRADCLRLPPPPVTPTACPQKAVCFWLCVIILKLASYISDS